jgi:hypothetical protein
MGLIDATSTLEVELGQKETGKARRQAMTQLYDTNLTLRMSSPLMFQLYE